MPNASELDTLPSYSRPPVVETVLGIQFDRLQRAKNAHFGAFWKTLGSDWPGIMDAALLPLQLEQFEPPSGWARALHVQLTQDPACRLQIKNADGSRMIQVQNTRLHFNWLGQKGVRYPRFGTVRDGFMSVLERFRRFAADSDLGDFRPNQWEVTYVNQIPQGTVWNTPADWGFFRPLASVPNIEGVIEGESFGGEWHFVIPPKRGRLHIEWQHGKASPDIRDDARDFIRLTLTARGPIDAKEDGTQATLAGLNLGRETIVLAFQRLMSDEANRNWGLNQCQP